MRKPIDYQFTVIYERDDEEGGWIASVPALHCHTQGDTKEEVEQNIKEAVLCTLEGFQAIGKDIPQEDNPNSQIHVKPVHVHLQSA